MELAALAGLHLDPWEAFVLERALGERVDGSWAAFEVGLVVARQNGKGAVLQARELAGLFLLGEQFITHSAHQFDTSLEAFRRLLGLIEDTPDLDAQVHRVSRSHGEEGIELRSRARIRFRTRTKGGGRGFSGDCLILDESMDLPTTAHGALLPTLSARPNPQVWYTGSAVDQNVHEHGEVLARIRARGIAGDDPALAYFEWSPAFEDVPDAELAALADDPRSWANANPGMGIRISGEYIARERRSLNLRTFLVERLSVGDWPAVDGGWAVIREDAWRGCEDRRSRVADQPVFAVDVALDGSWSSVAVTGTRSDGRLHVELVDYRPGTGWVADRLVDIAGRWSRAAEPAVNAAGPAGALIADLEAAGLRPRRVGTAEMAQACGAFAAAVKDRDLAHIGQTQLDGAVRGAEKRALGETWAWTRKGAAVDISPLVAATLARYLHVVTAPGVVDLMRTFG